MKLLATAIFAGLMTIGTAACAKEEPKKPTTPAAEVKKEEPKKERVCIKILDNKTNKEVEKCRMMKKHEKHEGTAVPEGKKK